MGQLLLMIVGAVLPTFDFRFDGSRQIEALLHNEGHKSHTIVSSTKSAIGRIVTAYQIMVLTVRFST